MEEIISEKQNEVSIINLREKILHWDITDFSDLSKIKKSFLPYNQGKINKK